MGNDKRKIRAVSFLVITSVLWSIAGIFIKSVEAHPMAIAGVRSLIAGIIILLYVKKPKFSWSFPQIAAAVAYALTVIMFVLANKLTTAANAILLQYTMPIYVALLSAWLLKEKPMAIDWVTIFAVLCGLLLFFVEELDTRGMAGNIIAALSGVSFAFFAIFMRMQKDNSPIESVILGNGITAVVGLPFLSITMPNPKGWLFLIILGVVQLGISYIFYSEAIKDATAIETSIITILEPILSPLWVFLMLREKPSAFAIIGGVIVVAAVTVRSIIVASYKLVKKEPSDEGRSLAS